METTTLVIVLALTALLLLVFALVVRALVLAHREAEARKKADAEFTKRVEETNAYVDRVRAASRAHVTGLRKDLGETVDTKKVTASSVTAGVATINSISQMNLLAFNEAGGAGPQAASLGLSRLTSSNDAPVLSVFKGMGSNLGALAVGSVVAYGGQVVRRGCLEFGAYESGKDADAGKICYGAFGPASNALDIVGQGAAGTASAPAGPKLVRVWDALQTGEVRATGLGGSNGCIVLSGSQPQAVSSSMCVGLSNNVPVLSVRDAFAASNLQAMSLFLRGVRMNGTADQSLDVALAEGPAAATAASGLRVFGAAPASGPQHALYADGSAFHLGRLAVGASAPPPSGTALAVAGAASVQGALTLGGSSTLSVESTSSNLTVQGAANVVLSPGGAAAQVRVHGNLLLCTAQGLHCSNLLPPRP